MNKVIVTKININNMSNFKPGQRVSFFDDGYVDKRIKKPAHGEIITLKEKCPQNNCCWLVVEYPFALTYQIQSFNERHLRPLQYENISNEIVSQLKTIDERCDVEIKQIETIETIKQ